MKHNKLTLFISSVRDIKKNIWSRHSIVLMSFFLPVLILLVGYATRGIFPFGSRDLLMIDLYHQYAPFLAGLREKLLTFSSFQYSWDGGLGTSFLPLFAYYLSSPLNIIIVLFPKEFLTEAVFALVLIKVGLCGACFSIYLKGVYKDNKKSVVAFSLMYALSAYVLGYSWNIMWLDCVFLLPLVVLGLTELVKGKSAFLFCISLAVMIYSNFYAAFFGCLFIVFYYPVCLARYNSLNKPKLLLKITARFAGYALLAAGLVAFLIVPTWYALKLTSASGDIFPKSFVEYLRFLDYLPSHLLLYPPTVREGMPNIYSGLLVLILVPLYFLSRNIKNKDKILNALLIIFMISSFNINILNFIWHGMHFPNQLPFRNSYVYIFLMLSIAYAGFRNLKEFTGKQIGAVCGALIAVVLIYQKVSQPEMNILVFYSSIIFLMIYAGVLTLHKRPGFNSSSAAAVFFVIVITEIAINTFVGINTVDNKESYAGRNGYSAGAQPDEIRDAIDKINSEDSSFFRMELIPPRTTNDPYLYGYKGLSIFASTFPEKTVKSVEEFGYHSNSINSYKYEGSTIVADSLFGIKYLLRKTYSIDDRLRKELSSTQNLTVFTNPYAISLGFFAPSDMKTWYSSGNDPFSVQSSLVRDITGIDNIFERLTIEKGESQNMAFETFGTSYIKFRKLNTGDSATAKIILSHSTDQQIYFYLDISPNKVERGFVMIDDKKIDFNAKRSTIVDLGYCSAGSVIEIDLVYADTSAETGNFEIRAYALDQAIFEDAIGRISKDSFIVDKYTDNTVKGHIDAPKDGLVVLTVPYDKGWSVMVDGVKTETAAFDSAFLCFDIKQGYHDIAMRFTADKFNYSLIISLFSLTVLIYLMLLRRSKKRRVNL